MTRPRLKQSLEDVDFNIATYENVIQNLRHIIRYTLKPYREELIKEIYNREVISEEELDALHKDFMKKRKYQPKIKLANQYTPHEEDQKPNDLSSGLQQFGQG